MKKHYKEKIFRSPIYPAEIVFVNTNNEKKLNKRHQITFKHHTIHAHTITQIVEKKEFNERRYYIIMDTGSKLGSGGVGVGCLAHECFHLSNMIFDFIGAIPTFENDEPQAYLIHYLMNEGLKFFFNYTNEKPK